MRLRQQNSISVVICTYNGEKYIGEQIESILGQTLLPEEIIVGDDGSNDGTLRVIEELRVKIEEKGIRLSIYNNDHLGPHDNFKQTLPLATCELIAPCDQDDIWLPKKLEKCLAAMADGVEVVACRDQIQNEDGSMGSILGHTLEKHLLVFGNNVSGHLMLVKRNSLNVFSIAPKVTFDWGLALYAASTGRSVLIEDVECIWRRHPGVVTTAVSANKGFEIEKLGKWTKLYKSLWLMMHKVYSEPIATTMNNNAIIFAHYGQSRYSRLAKNISRQKPRHLIKACWQHAMLRASLDDYKQLSFHDKIGYWCYQFCYPAIWWYDYFTHKSL